MRNDYTDYIQHGLFSKKHKYVAKVKYGPGATASRYFYNNDDYQAYLKNKNAKVTVNAPASVMANHKINQARLRAKNVGSTLSKTVANVGEKLSNLTSTVKAKTGSATNAFINGRPAGIHQKPSRGVAGAAYTAKNKATELRNKAALTAHVIDNKLDVATRKAKKIAGKWKTDATAASSKAKLAAGKAWKEAGVAYDNASKKAKKAASNAKENYKYYIEPAIKAKASEVYNKASSNIKGELAVSKKELTRAKKRINNFISDAMSDKLSSEHGDTPSYRKAMAAEYRKQLKRVEESTEMPEVKMLWRAQLIADATKNGFVKYMIKNKKVDSK